MTIQCSFLRLFKQYGGLSNAELEKENVVVEGRLMHQRRISRKCCFYDLQSCSEENDMRMEVILKIIDDELSIEQLETIRHPLNMGDVVHIYGFLEKRGESLILHARDIRITKTWKEQYPNKTFVPCPTQRNHTNNKSTPNSQSCVSECSTMKLHCKFWINSGRCQMGDACQSLHVAKEFLKEERKKWLKERIHLKRMRAHHQDDPHDPHSKNSKSDRAKIFCEWLLKTFGGVKELSQGKGVVDIAGGRGGIFFEVAIKHQIPCTLIDPRPFRLSKMQYKYLKKCKIDAKDIINQKLELFNMDSFLSVQANENLIKEAQVLVGMHPDEATDAILNVALKYNKPFAIVPCCVFSHQFPHRRIQIDQEQQQKPVVSYEDFIVYLKAKHSKIKSTYLPIDGKNLVLYYKQEDTTSDHGVIY